MIMKRKLGANVALVSCCCAFWMIANSPAVYGDCVVPDNGGGTITLPPAGCAYLSPDEVHMIIDGLPPGTTIEFAPIHRDFICESGAQGFPGCPPPGICEVPGPGTGNTDCFISEGRFQVNGTGTLAGFNRSISIPLSCQVRTAARAPGAPVQSFDTSMFFLQGQIFGDPDFDQLQITAGNGFGLPSPGHTTLTQLPGGNWAVDSFFDITYRIDFVGAPGGPLGGMSGSTTGTIRMEAGLPPGAGLACCLPNGQCVDVTTTAQCAQIGGIAQPPGSSCFTVNCGPQIQACCLPTGGCLDLDPVDCDAHGGISQGPAPPAQIQIAAV
ncbi:MAG: hypothetical protein IPK83_11435 [Planctomycetes bacterium]|nr:hypothetical protein [Planctomycetota bacterium]